MNKPAKYFFDYQPHCNMCFAQANYQIVLGMRLNKAQGKRPYHKVGIAVSVMKCKSCGLVYANPQPIPFNIEDHYGIDPSEYWKESYFNVPANYFKHEISLLHKFTGKNKGLQILDVGAGIGKVMKALTQKGHHVTGIEPSRPFFNAAIEKMGIGEENIHCIMLEDAGFPAESFDFINLGVVLEHMYNPSKNIEKIMHWLKPGGYILIEVPSANWLIARLANFLYKIQGLDYVSNLSPMHPPYHLYEFTLDSFKLNGMAKGYEVIYNEFYVLNTYLPRIFNKPLKWYMRKKNSGMQMMVWLKKIQ